MRMADRFCANCGAARREGDLFCPGCGLRYPETRDADPAPSFICPRCGSEEEGSSFCSRCGMYLGPKKEKKERKRRRGAGRVLLRVLAALLALAVILGGLSLAAGGSARGTRDWFRAVRYLAKGNLYSAADELEGIDTPIASAALKAVRRSAYRRGVRAYHAGEYGEASQMFRICGETAESGRYSILADAHLCDSYYNDSTCQRMVDGILGMWDFEDAPDALVYNDCISRHWLSGRWETEDGKHFFEIADGHLRYNLPNDVYGDAFRIRCGYLVLYFRDSGEEGGKVFRFYPMDRDSVSIFCIKDKQYYNLYRTEAD